MMSKVRLGFAWLLVFASIAPAAAYAACPFMAEPPEVGFRNNMTVGEEETKKVVDQYNQNDASAH